MHVDSSAHHSVLVIARPRIRAMSYYMPTWPLGIKRMLCSSVTTDQFPCAPRVLSSSLFFVPSFSFPIPVRISRSSSRQKPCVRRSSLRGHCSLHPPQQYRHLNTAMGQVLTRLIQRRASLPLRPHTAPQRLRQRLRLPGMATTNTHSQTTSYCP